MHGVPYPVAIASRLDYCVPPAVIQFKCRFLFPLLMHNASVTRAELETFREPSSWSDLAGTVSKHKRRPSSALILVRSLRQVSRYVIAHFHLVRTGTPCQFWGLMQLLALES
jgi:hypothetical protein